jgi:hypothetical protein
MFVTMDARGSGIDTSMHAALHALSKYSKPNVTSTFLNRQLLYIYIYGGYGQCLNNLKIKFKQSQAAADATLF